MAPAIWWPSAAAQPIWELASGYASDRRRRHPLWMLEAYFDDSGTGQFPVLVLAGFLSTAERWACFNEEWQAILDQEPGLSPFKMKHAMSGTGIWRLFSQEKRASLHDQFHSVIMKHAMFGFGCVIHHEAFDEMIKERLGFTETAYQIAFTGILAATMRFHKKYKMEEKIDFVFDKQIHEFDIAIASFIRIFKESPYLKKFIAGTPRSETDDRVLPLQAADYLAWQLRRTFFWIQSKRRLHRDNWLLTRPITPYPMSRAIFRSR